MARTADCVVMQVEAHKAEIQIPKLTLELEAVGIRLNQVQSDFLTPESLIVEFRDPQTFTSSRKKAAV